MSRCHACGAIQIKKPRQPNDYNLFVAEAMKLPEIKKLDPKERMKQCSVLWNARKEKGGGHVKVEKVEKVVEHKPTPKPKAPKKRKIAAAPAADYDLE
jgi:hypothetical protein